MTNQTKQIGLIDVAITPVAEVQTLMTSEYTDGKPVGTYWHVEQNEITDYSRHVVVFVPEGESLNPYAYQAWDSKSVFRVESKEPVPTDVLNHDLSMAVMSVFGTNVLSRGIVKLDTPELELLRQVALLWVNVKDDRHELSSADMDDDWEGVKYPLYHADGIRVGTTATFLPVAGDEPHVRLSIDFEYDQGDEITLESIGKMEVPGSAYKAGHVFSMAAGRPTTTFEANYLFNLYGVFDFTLSVSVIE